MALKASFNRYVFQFRFDARTSRGIIKERVSWFLKIGDEEHPEIFGIGECAPLQGLSPEYAEDMTGLLEPLAARINELRLTVVPETLAGIRALIHEHLPDVKESSLIFALETAFLDLAGGGERKLFKNSFTEGASIPINGLIWMGGMDFMLQQIEIKVRDGFRCLKLKVGGIDFEKECDILQYVRRKYFRENIILRLDANGAFKEEEALYKLNELSRFQIHSIEQPLKTGSALLPELCVKSPIPIALDEEMIGTSQPSDKVALLERIKPAFIILKPTLHGGFLSTAEWIDLATRRNIGWWITSALESNIGLNAIAQFTAGYPVELPQGLGTGSLYENNFESPLKVKNDGTLSFISMKNWDLSPIS